jgi:pyruvate/2-oxoglutarate dehydrogenase complex dihydrolipoamide dehydrogenase (E3) component
MAMSDFGAARDLVSASRNDEALIALVRPRHWTNPKAAGRYNLVVVGGGTAGLVSAVGAASLGAKVALVERGRLGGDCLNYGCVPSKALLRAAAVAHDARSAGRFGVAVSGVEVDFAAVMERVREARATIAPNDSAERLKRAGVDVFFGEGRFVERDALEVDGQRLRFARAVIATGGRPRTPNIAGLAEAGFVTNETVFSLTERPRRLGVIGGGPIGCELAQAFGRLGSEVTLLSDAPRLLPRDDARASSLLSARFEAEGIELVFGAQIQRVERRDSGKRVVYRRADASERAVDVDEILVAAGREPNVTALGLEATGVAYDDDGIAVDDRLRTRNRRIFAAGDVCSKYKFTHAADAMARIALQNALFFGRRRASALVIPWATYTDPEVAHVGVSSEDAERLGLKAISVELSEIDRAVIEGSAEGYATVYAGGGRGRVHGATIVARGASSHLTELVLAMSSNIPLARISGVVHPYPTEGEVVKRLADAFMRTKLTPGVLALLRRWLAWHR